MKEEPKTTITTKSVQDGYGPSAPTITIATIATIAGIVMVSIPLLLIIGHAMPVLDDFFSGIKPIAGYLGLCTGIALIILLFRSVWYAHDRFKVDIKRRSIEARLFPVDEHGNYPALFRETAKMFVVPKPSATIQPVPQSYAPHIHIDNSSKGAVKEIVDAVPPELNIARPQVSELAQRIERNSLQLCLGRSLTDGSYIIAELTGTHFKIIGATQMGKSCEAGAIFEEIQMTHDPQRLCFALLDLEYKTSRLFEKSEHLAVLSTGRGREIPCHAKSIDEVPTYLHYLVEELERRDRIASYQEVEELPHIIVYIEEFLDLKKQLRIRDKKLCNQFLTDFGTLATRGLKLGLHLMPCAQVDYADDDLKDSMAQFLGLNLAFGVKPEAARAAGFISSELLSQNYAAREKGQFVVEMVGGADLGIAPDFDVKAKLKELSESKAKLLHIPDQNVLDAALQAKLEQIMEVPGEGMKDSIKRVWGATPGDNQGWHNAKREYEEVLKTIHAFAMKGMQQEQ